jgi:hypothetical protein
MRLVNISHAVWHIHLSAALIVSFTFHHFDNMFSTIFQGRVMYKKCVETVGQAALKLTGFLKTLMQRRN